MCSLLLVVSLDLNGFQFSLSSTGLIMRSHKLQTHVTFCFKKDLKLWDIHITDETKSKRSKSRKIASIASYTVSELWPIVFGTLAAILEFILSCENKDISEIYKIEGQYESYSPLKKDIKLHDEHYYIEVSGHKEYERDTIFPIFPNISEYFCKNTHFEKGEISELRSLNKLPSIILLKKDNGEQLIAIHNSIYNSIFNIKREEEEEYFVIPFESFVELKESFAKVVSTLMAIKGDIIKSINEFFPILDFFDWVSSEIGSLPININHGAIEIDFNRMD